MEKIKVRISAQGLERNNSIRCHESQTPKFTLTVKVRDQIQGVQTPRDLCWDICYPLEPGCSRPSSSTHKLQLREELWGQVHLRSGSSCAYQSCDLEQVDLSEIRSVSSAEAAARVRQGDARDTLYPGPNLDPVLKTDWVMVMARVLTYCWNCPILDTTLFLVAAAVIGSWSPDRSSPNALPSLFSVKSFWNCYPVKLQCWFKTWLFSY